MHDIVVVTCVFLVQSLSPEAMEPAFELQAEIFQDKIIKYSSQAYEKGILGSAQQDYVVTNLKQEFAAAWHSMALSSVTICGIILQCGHFLQHERPLQWKCWRGIWTNREMNQTIRPAKNRAKDAATWDNLSGECALGTRKI